MTLARRLGRVTVPTLLVGGTSDRSVVSPEDMKTMFGYLGTLGRNKLIGPGYGSVDFVATRKIRLSEGQRLQFRLEVFNLLNRPNFAAPQNSATGGVIVFNSLNGIPVGNAPKIFSTVGSSRQLQLGLRWSF
jgi:hypothetical protein